MRPHDRSAEFPTQVEVMITGPEPRGTVKYPPHLGSVTVERCGYWPGTNGKAPVVPLRRERPVGNLAGRMRWERPVGNLRYWPWWPRFTARRLPCRDLSV